MAPPVELGRFRLVIDFDHRDEAEAAYMATLVYLHLKLHLRREGFDSATSTLHGVRQLNDPSK